MKTKRSARRYFLLAGSFLWMVAGLAAPSTGLGASASSHANKAGLYTISINPPQAPVCVGESRTVMVSWGLNPDPTALAPLSGPSAIYMSANLGSLDRYRTTPLVPAGSSIFEYTAEKEGTEHVHAQAMTGEDSDAGAAVSFPVKRCEYKYKLYAEGNLDNQGSTDHMSFRFVIRSEGQLKATDPSKPQVYEAIGKEVREATMITAFDVSDCTLFTWEPGTGSGFVDVKAQPAGDKKAMVVQFAPPRSFQTTYEMRAVCNSDPVDWKGMLPVDTHDDPWIEVTFPNGQGIQQVKLDIFERAISALNSNPHTHFSYSAHVTLEKVVPQ